MIGRSPLGCIGFGDDLVHQSIVRQCCQCNCNAISSVNATSELLLVMTSLYISWDWQWWPHWQQYPISFPTSFLQNQSITANESKSINSRNSMNSLQPMQHKTTHTTWQRNLVHSWYVRVNRLPWDLNPFNLLFFVVAIFGFQQFELFWVLTAAKSKLAECPAMSFVLVCWQLI